MTTQELHDHMKDAFDQAEAGQTVLITRKGKVFTLQLMATPTTRPAVMFDQSVAAMDSQQRAYLDSQQLLAKSLPSTEQTKAWAAPQPKRPKQ